MGDRVPLFQECGILIDQFFCVYRCTDKFSEKSEKKFISSDCDVGFYWFCFIFVPKVKLSNDRVKILVVLLQLKCHCFCVWEQNILNLIS